MKQEKTNSTSKKSKKRIKQSGWKKKKQGLCEKIIMGMLVFFCIVLLTALVYLFWLVYSNPNATNEQTQILPEAPAESETEVVPDIEMPTLTPGLPTPTSEPVQDIEEQTQESVDTQLEYAFRTEEITIEIPGVEREYVLAWISDLHMVSDLEPAWDVQEEFMDIIRMRYEFFKTEDGVYSKNLWPPIVNFLNQGQFDGVIFGGDMMDYCSKSNLDIFLEGYNRIDVDKIMYIRADHDYGYWYGGDALSESDAHEFHAQIDGDVFEKRIMDFENFSVVGINNSTQNMTYKEYDNLVSVLGRGKPVIIVTHVPYESKVEESLEQLSMEFRNKIYYWGGGDYVPFGATEQYFEIIYSDYTSVCQVLAGHLHKPWDGKISERVRQHIFSPAFEGVIGIIHIVPTE